MVSIIAALIALVGVLAGAYVALRSSRDSTRMRMREIEVKQEERRRDDEISRIHARNRLVREFRVTSGEYLQHVARAHADLSEGRELDVQAFRRQADAYRHALYLAIARAAQSSFRLIPSGGGTIWRQPDPEEPGDVDLSRLSLFAGLARASREIENLGRNGDSAASRDRKLAQVRELIEQAERNRESNLRTVYAETAGLEHLDLDLRLADHVVDPENHPRL